MTSIQQLAKATEGITCHAWNADQSMIALCPNNNELHIYGNCNTATWTRLHVLNDHDLVISGIDWSHRNNKIVSCSHDRNAFVWTYEASSDKWIPALVILRIDRAALDVKWSLDGLRFAVTSGAKCVPVCTYEGANDWWVSKMLKKKFKSTVTCCAFHPTNGQLLATGSTDFKCRVFSTFSSEVDGTPNAGDFEKPLEFGDCYLELSSQGWVNAVAWSPSGKTLCFVGHDSSIHLASEFSTAGAAVHQIIRFRELPLTSLVFVSETAVIGAGHEFNPFVFTKSGGNWSFFDKLDKKKEASTQAATSSVGAARALFQNKSARGQDAADEKDKVWTVHENAITCMQAMPAKGKAISSSALDGKVVVWELPKLEIALASLGL